jgi:hypothetical protein
MKSVHWHIQKEKKNKSESRLLENQLNQDYSGPITSQKLEV